MEGGKKVAIVVVLLVVIVAVAGLTMKSRMGADKPPERYQARSVEKIDIETSELITKTVAEWAELGAQNGLFKHPTTGNFTMDSVWVDPENGEKIPYSKSPEATDNRGREGQGGDRAPSDI